MYLLYADESGDIHDPRIEHFVLAGVSVFETRTYGLIKKLDDIADEVAPRIPQYVELHASPMFTGNKFWRKIPQEDRIHAMKKSLQLIDGKDMRVFAVVIKKDLMPKEEILENCVKQLVSRFDMFLGREYRHHGKAQRGLVIFDRQKGGENIIQQLVEVFRDQGHDWGRLRNMADVPVFVDSTATRLVQLADLVAYALFRKYEHGDDELFSVIEDKFDYSGKKRHGLYEKIV